jgi:hypothetical protein
LSLGCAGERDNGGVWTDLSWRRQGLLLILRQRVLLLIIGRWTILLIFLILGQKFGIFLTRTSSATSRDLIFLLI